MQHHPHPLLLIQTDLNEVVAGTQRTNMKDGTGGGGIQLGVLLNQRLQHVGIDCVCTRNTVGCTPGTLVVGSAIVSKWAHYSIRIHFKKALISDHLIEDSVKLDK